jgi:hypothetical protein
MSLRIGEGWDVHALVAGPPLPPHDLRAFERTLLPRWLAQFALPSPQGGYRFALGDAAPHAYGAAGVVHALSVVGQLGTLLNESTRAAYWAAAAEVVAAAAGWERVRACARKTNQGSTIAGISTECLSASRSSSIVRTGRCSSRCSRAAL